MAHLALILATVIWGATFVVMEWALADLPVYHLLAYRFTLGSLLLAPLAWQRWRRARAADPEFDGRRLLRDGVLVGSVLFVAFSFQTWGLVWTTPSRAAFLTGLSVLLVPAMGWVAGAVRPRLLPLLGAACAAGGLWALFQPWGDPTAAPFNLGDALAVGCAAGFAAHVLVVERTVRRHPLVPLVVVQFATVAVLSAPSLLLDPPGREHLTTAAVTAVAVTGVFATALAFGCQLYAQRRLGSVETAVLLSLEPVAAAALSIAVGREALDTALLVGGALILAGMLMADVGSPPPEPPGAAVPRS